MSLFDVVVSVAGLVGLGWIFWLTLIDGRRKHVPGTLLVVSGLNAICGLASSLLGGAHFFAVMGRALRGAGLQGAPDFSYNFRFYSLVMLGILLAVPGILCLRSASGLTKGEPAAWKNALWSSIVLMVVNGPLIPIQRFAILLGGLALLNAVVLVTSRQRIDREGRS
jgi:hypothetical protein